MLLARLCGSDGAPGGGIEATQPREILLDHLTQRHSPQIDSVLRRRLRGCGDDHDESENRAARRHPATLHEECHHTMARYRARLRAAPFPDAQIAPFEQG